MAGFVPMIYPGPVQVSCASSSGSPDLILRSLIEGRSVSSVSTSPTSLLEVFRKPYRYKDQSLAGLLSDVAGALVERVETELEGRPLSEEGLASFERKQNSYTTHQPNLERMQEFSIPFGMELLTKLGYEFEEKDLDKPRAFILGAISLAEVGRKYCDWLSESKMADIESLRVEKLAILMAIAEMIIKKEAGWVELRSEPEAWELKGTYVTASDIKFAYSQGVRNFREIKLFGPKEDRDLSGVSLIQAEFHRANLTRADLSRADLFQVSLYGADLSKADLNRTNFFRTHLLRTNLSGTNISEANLDRIGVIDDEALLSLNSGEWAGNLTLVERIKAWLARGWGNIYLVGNISGQDFSGVNLSGVTLQQGVKLTGSSIDTIALNTLNMSYPIPLTLEQKIALWKERGGIVVDEEK
jgi:uncharacterized protein YjbI with pentapeptide repeats